MSAASTPEELIEKVWVLAEPSTALTFSLGSHTLSLYPCCSELSEPLELLFGHLSSSHRPEAKMVLIGSKCAHRYPLAVSWAWPSHEYSVSNSIARFNGDWQSLSVSDAEQTLHVFASKRLDEASLGRREYMRLILMPLLDAWGVLGIHGATIGSRTTGVLLSNRGGSGKSTLVAQALKDGMFTAGDDFLLLDSQNQRGNTTTLHSYFSNLKLHAESPASAGLSLESLPGEEKALVHAGRDFPGQLVAQHVLKAILIPTIGTETRLTSISEEECWEAIIPSSIVLTTRSESLVVGVKELSRTAPLFRLEVGPNPTEALTLIRGLVS